MNRNCGTGNSPDAEEQEYDGGDGVYLSVSGHFFPPVILKNFEFFLTDTELY
jgi:hypothetical protein